MNKESEKSTLETNVGMEAHEPKQDQDKPSSEEERGLDADIEASADPNYPGSISVKGLFYPLNGKSGQLLGFDSLGHLRPQDPYVSRELIRRFKLKKGNQVEGHAYMGDKFPNPKVNYIHNVDGLGLKEHKACMSFEELTSMTPNKHIRLETESDILTTRVIDLFCPIGKGQRGLIVAPPRTGKTTLLQDIAKGVRANHPECHLIVLLVDERPEEVTDFKHSVDAELFASSNDEPLASHIAVSDVAIERAKRLVERGKDVVLLIDSLTRLSRVHNSMSANSGRTMTGGLDVKALEKPRQLFSAARNTEEAGSLTIIASALIETGSRMDDYIFQEFKGTGNMEMVLDSKVSNMRIFPAINLAASGTRREELLLDPNDLHKIHLFRRALVSLHPKEAAETLMNRMEKTKSNAELLKMISG